MSIRKVQFGWMTLGVLVCLAALTAVFQLRDANRALAQTDPLPKPPLPLTESLPPSPESKECKSEPTGAEEPAGVPLPPIPEPKEIKSAKPEKADLSTPPEPVSPEPPPTSTDPLVSFPPPAPAPLPPAAEPAPARVAEPPPAVPEPGSPPVASPPLAGPAQPARRPESPHAPAPLMEPEPVSVPAPQATHNGTTQTPDPASPPTTMVKPVGYPPSVPGQASTHIRAVTGPSEPTSVRVYRVRADGETLEDVAQRTLGTSKRAVEIQQLNPGVDVETSLMAGTRLRLPVDAQTESSSPVQPLPSLRPDRGPGKPDVVLPLTGTYVCEMDDNQIVKLPPGLRKQLETRTILVSPGPDRCLWVTDQAHLERLGKRLEQSSAREADVRVFKRLYYAQIEKVPVNSGGRIVMPERLARFAGLKHKIVIVGIDDHFEVWDMTKWRRYTREKTASRGTRY